MNEMTTIGVDPAKTVFQLHCVDQEGQTSLCRRLPRSEMLAFFEDLPGCLKGMEACSSAHYWVRERT